MTEPGQVTREPAFPASDVQSQVRDSLAEPPRRYPSVVLANPPFGKKSSITVIGENGSKEREDISYARPDFWETTANKQLNFVQHIAAMLGIPGRAAVVVPDNVLFEGGAGETVRRRLFTPANIVKALGRSAGELEQVTDSHRSLPERSHRSAAKLAAAPAKCATLSEGHVKCVIIVCTAGCGGMCRYRC